MRIETRQPVNRLGLDDDLLDRVFAARGITEPAQLERGLSNLLSPADLPEIDQAAKRLADAVVFSCEVNDGQQAEHSGQRIANLPG